jgi:putative tricarboxylic transport membrane protein
VILTFCVVGAYAINNSLFDIGILLVMGVLGFLMERHGLPVAPVVLGIVLGPIVEKNFMFSVIKTDWHFAELFSRPVSGILIVLTLTTWFVAFVKPILDRWRARRLPADR